MTTPIVRWSCALLVLAAAGTLAACGGHKGPEERTAGPLSGKITVDGSDTVFPLSKAMAEAFRESNPGVQFAIEFSGTGDGFKKFCAGELDIEDASRPIRSDEGEQCKAQHIEYIEVPVAFDSLSVVVNPKNAFVDCLTVKELKAMWEPAAEGKTSQWTQIRASFPALPLALFGPGKASGTFDYFTFAVVGTEASSRGDYTKSEDYTVIAHGVAADPNALGYFGYAYYQANKDQLKLVGVDNGRGCIIPNARTVADGTYQPLSRPLFVYVNVAAAARPEVKAFTRFYLASASTKIVTKVGYVPLPSNALVAQASRFEKGVTGSALGGHGSVTGVKLDVFDEWEKEKDRNDSLAASD
ncbi:MAG: PstS family phosphate ABC transporter substrate-binding protein [Steroidobacteraceae bacterium]